MATIASLVVDVLANTVQLQKDVHKVEDTLGKMGQMAKNAGKLLAGAFVVDKIVDAGMALINFTGELTDLSAKTGIGTTALQKLKFAAEQNGGTLDQVTKSIAQMSNRLVNGDKAAVGALNQLGLSMSDLRRMQPDEAFTAIADAIGKVPDPMGQSALAMAIFGKQGAELLPMMKGNFKELGEEAENTGLILSEDVVKAGDDFGDTLGKLAQVGMAFIGKVLGPFLPLLQLLADGLLKTASIVSRVLGPTFEVLIAIGKKVIDFLVKMVEAVIGFVSKIPGVSTIINGLKSGFEALKAGAIKLHESLVPTKVSTEGVGTAAAKTIPTIQGMTKAQDDANKATKEAAKVNKENMEWLQRHEEAAHKLRLMMLENTNAFIKLREEQRLGLHVLRDTVGLNLLLKSAADDLVEAFKNLERLKPRRPLDELKESVDEVIDKLKGFGGKLKESLLQDLKQIPQILANAFTGGGDIKGAVKAIGTMIGSTIGQAVGESFKALGKLGGPLGSAIGSLLGPLAGAVAGLFDKLFGSRGRDMVKEFAATFGGFDALRKKLGELGDEGERLWIRLTQGVGRNNPEQAKAAIEAINAAFGKQTADLALLKQAMEEYGFTWEDLPAAARASELAGMFDILHEKTRVLREAGIDYSEILRRQAGDYSELVNKAILTGTEIPAAMRPVLEDLVEMGLLVDENGKAFTDLSKVKWAETMTEGFDRVVKAVDRLTDALTEGVGGALDKIGKTVVHPKIVPHYQAPPEVPMPGEGPESFSNLRAFQPRGARAAGAITINVDARGSDPNRTADAMMRALRRELRLNVA